MNTAANERSNGKIDRLIASMAKEPGGPSDLGPAWRRRCWTTKPAFVYKEPFQLADVFMTPWLGRVAFPLGAAPLVMG